MEGETGGKASFFVSVETISKLDCPPGSGCLGNVVIEKEQNKTTQTILGKDARVLKWTAK